MDIDNIFMDNPKSKFIEKVFGPLFNFLLEYNISPLIIGLIFLIILCIKYIPSLKDKDGNYNDYVVLLIAATIIAFIAFLYTQIDLIVQATRK